MQSIESVRLIRTLAVVLAAAVLTACGTGDGKIPIPGTALGVLTDAPVSGAEYSTATLSGLTTADGGFRYLPGEIVTFSVGGVELGSVAGAPFITPVELTGSADPGTAAVPNAATSVLRFLQSVDADQNPLNGITISDATRNTAAGLSLDFETASDAEVDTVIGLVTSNPVIGSATALDNFYDNYKALGGSITFPWPFPGYPAFPGVIEDLLTNGGFEEPIALPNDVSCSTGWNCFNNSFTNNTGGSGSGPVSHEPGAQSLKQFGIDGGIRQAVPASPAADYVASVWAMNWSGDPLNNLGIVQLTFWDAPGGEPGNGNQLGPAFEAFVDGTDDGDKIFLPVRDGASVSDWTKVTISAKAPPGTVSAQLLLLHIILPNSTTGAGTVRWDDAMLVGPSSATPPPPPAALNLVWQDEFNTGTTPDPGRWTMETGYGANGWGNDEWQLYTDDPANISIVYPDAQTPANGYLSISAQLNTALCPSPTGSGCGKRDSSITSGRMVTLPRQPGQGYSFRYGRIQASIKLPVGTGTWPAFWMLGENFPTVGWPKTGEIDIMEMFDRGGTTNREPHFTLHWCDESLEGGVCAPFPTGYRSVTSKTNLGASLGSSFRVYEAEWNANGITWRVDGVPYYSAAIQPVTMEEFLAKFFVILNVAIGGNPVPNPDATGWPRTMLVDWVRVYQ
jgi:beta-glucanase (GH16 family)